MVRSGEDNTVALHVPFDCRDLQVCRGPLLVEVRVDVLDYGGFVSALGVGYGFVEADDYPGWVVGFARVRWYRISMLIGDLVRLHLVLSVGGVGFAGVGLGLYVVGAVDAAF